MKGVKKWLIRVVLPLAAVVTVLADTGLMGRQAEKAVAEILDVALPLDEPATGELFAS